tara:strand:- start:4613 stop:4987 length:375 start_codon:yes stop_codon:yes gene_type:complete
MAQSTLTPTLTLNSLGATSDTLNMSVTDALLISGNIAEFSRVKVLHTAPTVLQPASTGTFYLYVKNIGTNSRVVDIQIADDSVFASLAVGEFCFIPMKANVGIELLALVGTEEVEYGYWEKGSA